MPVATRSQISGGDDGSVLPRPRRTSAAPSMARDPHHALKEKMKALTQFYDQHQHQLSTVRRLSSRPDLLESKLKNGEAGREENGVIKKLPDPVMRENPLNVMPSVDINLKKLSLPVDPVESKENMEDRVSAFSCPKKELRFAPRKLSLGGAPIAQSEPRVLRSRRTSGDLGTISELPGSRIMVYVRVRPMARKEKEGGSRTCVRIVDRQEIYLTELASDADYLRLKRLRGRHFSFDASFPESTSQQEVYTTT